MLGCKSELYDGGLCASSGKCIMYPFVRMHQANAECELRINKTKVYLDGLNSFNHISPDSGIYEYIEERNYFMAEEENDDDEEDDHILRLNVSTTQYNLNESRTTQTFV